MQTTWNKRRQFQRKPWWSTQDTLKPRDPSQSWTTGNIHTWTKGAPQTGDTAQAKYFPFGKIYTFQACRTWGSRSQACLWGGAIELQPLCASMCSAQARRSSCGCGAEPAHIRLCSSSGTVAGPAGCCPSARHWTQCGPCAQSWWAHLSWCGRCACAAAGGAAGWCSKQTTGPTHPRPWWMSR